MVEIPQKIKELLIEEVSVAVLTGAGISAESGVPTFRGKDGFWKQHRAEELATVDAFMSDPELVWGWYQYRRGIVNGVEPNPGHFALALMEKAIEDFTLITQNVDNLHARAGSTDILELHGNIHRNKCIKCGAVYNKEVDDNQKEVPECECGGMIRPDVVWFGEMLPQQTLQSAFEAAERAELFFSIGTSAIVQPAASLPIAAKRHGACLVEINVESTMLTGYADEFLQGASGEILPIIIKECGFE